MPVYAFTLTILRRYVKSVFGLLVLSILPVGVPPSTSIRFPDDLMKSVSKPPTTTDRSKDSSEQTEVEHRLNQVSPMLTTVVIAVHAML